MKSLPRIFFPLVLLIVIFPLVFHTALAQENTPRFEKISCDIFDLDDYAYGAVEGPDVECGYLIVPENRKDPNGKNIKLGVMIIHSTNPNPAQDPLVLTQGGPGGSGIEVFAEWVSPESEQGQTLRADRDLIVLEQRGTQYSLPFLFCDEIFDLTIKTLDDDLTDDEEERMSKEALEACKQRLEKDDVDLSAYNSVENAADVADLVQALNLDKINFYGVSYGTQLGQHVMKEHPEILRSVILDGVVSLEINPNQNSPWAESRSFRNLFAACEENPGCNEHYPNLEQVYFDTIDALNQNPVMLPMTDLNSGAEHDVLLDGDKFSELTFQLLYVSEAIPLLPKLIYDVSKGVYDQVVYFYPLFTFTSTDADGMYFSVMCAEDFDYTPEDLNMKDTYAELAANEMEESELMLNLCKLWYVPELGPSADEPVISDIPTLLFSGDFDPVTPPPYADKVAETLSVHYKYIFPSNGHGAFFNDPCATSIASQFLNNPQKSPDATCLEEKPVAPVFVTPENTIMSRGAMYTYKAFYRMTKDMIVGMSSEDTSKNVLLIMVMNSVPLLFSWLQVLLLLIAPVIWFLGFVVNWLRKKGRDRRLWAMLAPWIGTIIGIMSAIYIGMQITIAGKAVLGLAGLQSIAGVPSSYTWVFVLAILVAFLTFGMITLAILAWMKNYWGIWTRLYFSLWTVVALVFTIFLTVTGQLTALF
jgi:pimeloyl-ACP methyl ester carboxylesterase